VLLEMTNPDVQLQALEAERQLGAAEANMVSLRNQLETTKLQQQATVATITTEANDAKRNAEVFEALDKKGLSSANEVARARERADELTSRRQPSEQRRLTMLQQTLGRQLALEEANVERMRAVAQFQRDRVASMNVVAGEEGVLQQLDLELGQWVVPGQILARVAQPGKLKAVLRVPETQAKDIVLGQPTSVDTRNGLVSGRVSRVDPAVQNGTVTVEVALEGALPRGARADLSVDGTIEIERLPNVLSSAAPPTGSPRAPSGCSCSTPTASPRAGAGEARARLGERDRGRAGAQARRQGHHLRRLAVGRAGAAPHQVSGEPASERGRVPLGAVRPQRPPQRAGTGAQRPLHPPLPTRPPHDDRPPVPSLLDAPIDLDARAGTRSSASTA
jgi:hypothetical protein